MALWRILLSARPGFADPLGRQTARMLRDFAVASVRTVRTARLFTIELPGVTADERSVIQRIADDLLTDPVTETCRIHRQGDQWTEPDDVLAVEVHFKPGVMDNVADSTLLALNDMGIAALSVRTARRYELSPMPDDDDLARIPRLLGNACIETVVLGTKPIEPPPPPPSYAFKLRYVSIRDLDGASLERLSREAHLFLSREEMQAIQAHYRERRRDPTDLELETLAQTWSEHCVHKTLKSAIEYRGAPFPIPGTSPRPWPEGTPAPALRDRAKAKPFVKNYANLLKDTIVRATDELIQAGRGPHCLSVFKDNAGIIAFDDETGVAFKVETHNHPSAIEPYGGAATGVGGCIRDILGCGLGAKPIANTDTFCVAPPDWPVDGVPGGVIHPKTILKGVVAGVRDYGNRMGIPTVNGAIHFDPRYLGNPLVFCGCVGLIPRDRIEKAARPGDAIVLMGGRTGRDGIHGATFSSAELTDTHGDEFAHAVQIGNPIEEKKILDVILQARDHPRDHPGEDPSDDPSKSPRLESPRPKSPRLESPRPKSPRPKSPRPWPGGSRPEETTEQQEHPPGTGRTSSTAPRHKSPRPWPGGTSVDRPTPLPALHPSSFILRPSRSLYSAVTDCGAGGLSSAVGEMGAEIGVEVDLEKVPLKYAGLRYDEIWISEAQERMVLAVPPPNVDTLLSLAGSEDVEATVIGRFTDTGRLVARYEGTTVGDLDMRFLHHGVPRTTRQAEWWPDESAQQAGPRPQTSADRRQPPPVDPRPPIRDPQPAVPDPQSPIVNRQSSIDRARALADELKQRLGDPTTASKHWVIRQYDHEVQGRSVIKPLVGPHSGPSDAAVLRPRLDSDRGIALGCGLAPQLADADPYWMAVAAIDEALRNVVCVGGDPSRTAILDNFCWPRVDNARSLGGLVRACQACYDVATAYGLPFISGKDSLNNEFALDPTDVPIVRAAMMKFGAPRRTSVGAATPSVGSAVRTDSGARAPEGNLTDPIRHGRLAIPETLLISAVSLIDDVTRCVSMDLKQQRARLFLIGQPATFAPDENGHRPLFDLATAAETHHVVARMIREGLVVAVHDVSDGGLLVACAEMAMAAGRGCRIRGYDGWVETKEAPDRSPRLEGGAGESEAAFFFTPSPGLYVVEVRNERAGDFDRLARAVPSLRLASSGATDDDKAGLFAFEVSGRRDGPVAVPLDELRLAWQAPLDW